MFVPKVSLPASALLPGLANDASPQIQTSKRLRQMHLGGVVAILEGVCGGIFCRTYAMQFSSYTVHQIFSMTLGFLASICFRLCC